MRAGDATQHRFVGKEPDAESNNHCFLARYCNSAIRRFLTRDWSAKEEPVPYAQMGDPQSPNLYAIEILNLLIQLSFDGSEARTQSCPPVRRVGWILGDFSACNLLKRLILLYSLDNLVPKKGLEPPHPCEYVDLNHARLPIPPLRHGTQIQRSPLNRQQL